MEAVFSLIHASIPAHTLIMRGHNWPQYIDRAATKPFFLGPNKRKMCNEEQYLCVCVCYLFNRVLAGIVKV